MEQVRVPLPIHGDESHPGTAEIVDENVGVHVMSTSLKWRIALLSIVKIPKHLIQDANREQLIDGRNCGAFLQDCGRETMSYS